MSDPCGCSTTTSWPWDGSLLHDANIMARQARDSSRAYHFGTVRYASRIPSQLDVDEPEDSPGYLGWTPVEGNPCARSSLFSSQPQWSSRPAGRSRTAALPGPPGKPLPVGSLHRRSTKPTSPRMPRPSRRSGSSAPSLGLDPGRLLPGDRRRRHCRLLLPCGDSYWRFPSRWRLRSLHRPRPQEGLRTF